VVGDVMLDRYWFGDVKRRLRTPVIIDGRNLYDPAMVRSFGLEYSGIGRTEFSHEK
jgi:hypothetical protein